MKLLRGTASQITIYLDPKSSFHTEIKINKIKKKEIEESTEKVKNVRYNLESLIHDSVKSLYQKRLNEKFLEKSELSFEDIYKNIIKSIHEAAKETLGIKSKKTCGGMMILNN